MKSCGFCGRDNDEQSKFCIDCGKPVLAGGARVISVAAIMKPGAGAPVVDDRASKSRGIPDTRVSMSAKVKGEVLRACPGCGAMIDPSLPFCPQCGVRVAPVSQEIAQASKCMSCGTPVKPGEDKFCAKCGARVGTATEAPPKPKGTAAFSAAGTTTGGPKIAIIDDAGTVKQTFQIEKAVTTVGRIDGDFRLPADPYLSPMHAQFSFRDGALYVRDLGSRNGTWVFIDAPYRLQDGDTILIGSQIVRFRRLGYRARTRRKRTRRGGWAR